MITVRTGSHMYNLLKLLSISGEFPSSSLSILGEVRTVKTMVHKMEEEQTIRLASNNSILATKLFQLSGRGQSRTVRVYKSALDIFNDLHPNALEHYLASFPDNKFSGNVSHVQRNHRVGEAVAMSMMAGVEVAPYILPELQKAAIRPIVPRAPSYYVARNFKKIYEAELNKTIFTRVVGLLFYPGGSYAVYNTRDAVMKWSGLGELKARQELSEIVRMNAGLNEVNSAFLLGNGGDIALQTLLKFDKTVKKQVRFDRIYQNIHFIPLNEDGIRLIKILILPDWHEKLMRALFSPEMRPKGYGSMEYDAYLDKKYILSHLDSDIARLIRFNEALQTQSEPFEILCFPWQVKFLKGYFGNSVNLKLLEMDSVSTALGIKNIIHNNYQRGNVFEKDTK